MAAPIYLDYFATTPVDPRVAQKMADCLTADGNFGNPASRSHRFGWKAEEAVELARRQVAELIGAQSREIVWTSGATESDNLALKGIADFYGEHKKHIISSSIEHKAVLDSCAYLAQQGFEISYLQPSATGAIAPQAVAEALREDTLLVSIMHANNEVATVNDVAAIGAITRAAGVPFHVDAAQSAAKVPIDVGAMNIDLLSLSAHKMYGPKGMGALYVRRNPPLQLAAQIHGGGHERGMRSGTLPTHQIVGMGEAARIAVEEMPAEGQRLAALRQQFWEAVSALPGVALNGDRRAHLPGGLNIRVDGVEGETLMMALKDLAISSGSACASASMDPSYVLRAMGLSDSAAHSSLRFSFGRFTSSEEVDRAASLFVDAVSKLRQAA